MNLIVNKQELLENMKRIDEYLENKTDPKYNFALDLIKKGTCFVVLSDISGVKFYPSRFIGYKNNTMNSHLSNDYKDGKETNPQISAIINNGKRPVFDLSLEQKYIEYCNSLGFIAREKGSFGVERKYWEL